jgi:ATP-dependent Zn protease
MAELRPAAYHEAGHGVTGIVLGGSFELISLVPRGLMPAELKVIDVAGGAQAKPNVAGHVVAMRFATAEHEFLGLLAGPLAEAHHRRRSRVAIYLGGGCHDLARARTIAAEIAGFDRAARLVDRMERRAQRFVREHWRQITALAEALLARRTMGFDEAVAVIRALEKGERP